MPPAGASGNPAIGPELMAAITARQGMTPQAPTATLNQTNQGAPMQAPPLPPKPGVTPPPGPADMANQPSTEAQLIVKALGQRLTQISKVEAQGGQQNLQSMPVSF